MYAAEKTNQETEWVDIKGGRNQKTGIQGEGNPENRLEIKDPPDKI